MLVISIVASVRMMLFLMFCGSVSTAVSAVRYELKSKSFGQMWFVYASGSDLIESRKTQKSGKRITTQQRMRIPCLTIEPHGTRLPRGLRRRRVAAIGSVSTRLAISLCS